MSEPLAQPTPTHTACAPRRRTFALLPALALLLGAVALIALGSGRYPLSAMDVLRFFASAAGAPSLDPARHDLLYNLLVEIRLPRVLAAILVGAALAVSGAAFQGVFRNPLVSPNLLGVLSGAAFGAAAGMLCGGSWLLVQASAFACGLAAVAIALMIARAFGQASLIMLILGGIVSGALFAALLSLVKYLADPYDELPAIIIWLMGSLASVHIGDALWVSIPMTLAITALCASGRWLDALAMGDDEARSLGVPVDAVRYMVIGCATLLGALTVSLAGMIGWVGLIVPHAARLLCGPGHALLLPASALLGASFLLAADLLARSLAGSEIPIGIVTELLGIPVFLLVLHRARNGWGR
ncbi:FecCD family ABC transporter permease [Stutzerimonas stutzeri]|uniref:FecCD family ABC transporter permease n=1 Tax=Stutzerimonas stutzeri TaxID=316 RepID=UPI0022442440|nr:iron ABC transporter permease [Stutzerimonas stutzeri]MCW8159475.1 iron ABC transporter permease [Stutzerimonas stutzeri]